MTILTGACLTKTFRPCTTARPLHLPRAFQTTRTLYLRDPVPRPTLLRRDDVASSSPEPTRLSNLRLRSNILESTLGTLATGGHAASGSCPGSSLWLQQEHRRGPSRLVWGRAASRQRRAHLSRTGRTVSPVRSTRKAAMPMLRRVATRERKTELRRSPRRTSGRECVAASRIWTCDLRSTCPASVVTLSPLL